MAADPEPFDYDIVGDFDRFYEDHYQSVYRVVRGVVLDPAVAEDLTQDAFVKAYRARHTWKPQQAPRVWLHRIAVNTAISHARRNQIQRRVFETIGRLGAARDVVDPTETVDRDLVDALKDLKPAQRAAVILHYYHGFRYAEIATILGVPEGTVGSRISIALKHIRQSLLAAGVRGTTAPMGNVVVPTVPAMNLDATSRVADIER